MRFELWAKKSEGEEFKKFKRYKTKRAVKDAIEEFKKVDSTTKWKLIDKTDNGVSYY